MCVQHSAKSQRRPNLALIYLIAIILGLIIGFSQIEPLQNMGLLISDIFIKIFKCISLPI
ncbi:MAG: hypothetical protein RIT35_1722, partial [Pseudomonadota bacterium]